jgi:ABC-type thiamin/hydroxymethylpyrimidine transport system permease subunit
MPGVILVVLALVVVLPVVVMLSGSVVAGILGWALKDNGEATHEGSELIDLNT